MSWRRIDENTYIDDTLVTCAEYQLFIDEMRYDVHKFYVPDHWTSYQFSEGMALEPILGVRFSDAHDFCVWLTKREDSGWHYRLPVDTEAKLYPVQYLGSSLRGYWTTEIDGKSQLIWVGVVDSKFKPLDLDHVSYSVIAWDLPIERFRHLARAFDRGRPQDRAENLDIALAYIDQYRDPERYTDIVALRERIAGRSPAFEGIRLVKERIR